MKDAEQGMTGKRQEPALRVENLAVHFLEGGDALKAVDGVSFAVRSGEIMALVGESGCGKSLTAQAIMGLVGGRQNERVSGAVWYGGENLLAKSEEEMRRLRGEKLAMVFQDPMTSLNPLFTVGDQVAEVPLVHGREGARAAWGRGVEMLGRVGIPAAAHRARDYPHQFSGGMRQRAVIAMSLVCRPDVLIADEPTTALDVTIQAQILDLLRGLRDETGSAIIFITHDLGVVAELCDSVSVMYAGKIVETATVDALFRRPIHPYTEALLRSVPTPHTAGRLEPIPGQPPQLSELEADCCPFHPRCPLATAECRRKMPPLAGDDTHRVACWHRGVKHG